MSFGLSSHSSSRSHKRSVAGVVFSKDRPLQLDATLASWKRHVPDAEHVSMTVLYVTSSQWSETLYQRVQHEHPEATFVRETSFRRDLLNALKGYPYVLFLVDDCLLVRPASIASAVAALDTVPRAVGVSFRLGNNTRYCYATDMAQQVPDMQPTEAEQGRDRWFSFQWTTCEHDFAYPLEVSSSLYRSSDILPILKAIRFRNPNQLEDRLSRRAATFAKTRPLLLAAETSLAFCNPCNRVQHDYLNRAGSSSETSGEAFMEAYARGERVRISALDGFTPSGCHEEVALPLFLGAAPVPKSEGDVGAQGSPMPLLKRFWITLARVTRKAE